MRGSIWITCLALTSVAALGSCKPKPENPYPGAENFGSQLLERVKAQCESDGGTFGPGGKTGGLVCRKTPADAGKSCTKQSDCSTQCLARSQTCAPLEPLFGCNEVLSANGARMTLCLD